MSQTIDALLAVREMQSYGCVKCQREHYSDQPEYERHLAWQSKHGVRRVASTVVADERSAASRHEVSENG